MGMISEQNQIVCNTELKPFQKERFYLKRELTDYPGLFAFNSSRLAYLAYFSPLAGLMHKLLYLFRVPFYDYKKDLNR